MKVFTFIIIEVIFIYSTARPINEEWPNVGTVLFSDKDLHREVWPKSDIALLEARRHFQHMIPPPELVSPTYNFVDTMIDYFKQSYTSIKDTASNPKEDSILTTALSDIIGGYLKLWIIPTAKFAFYSGVINKEQAFRVFSFYDEIRKYLQTDGSGWKAPDNTMLRTIVQNIPQTISQKSPQSHIRSTSADPCEMFAYFEKTPDGFTIPLPSINWEQNTMFVPLKNQSLVHLDSLNHSNMLVNYYTAAKSCLHTRSPNITDQFDEKVQSWLFQTVLPHLTDDRLYVALGNVMMLFNDTDTLQSNYPWEDHMALSKPDFVNKKTCSFKCQLKCYYKHIKNKIISIFACLWRHKMLTLSCLVLFEILWCMFAMNRMDIKIKRKQFCFCKKISIFFSQRGCQKPKKESFDKSDDDKDDLKKKYSKKGNKKTRKAKEYSSYNETAIKGKKEKEKNKANKSSSSADKTKEFKKDNSDKTTPPTKSSSNVKLEEKNKSLLVSQKSTSDTIKTPVTADKFTSIETTTQQSLKNASSSVCSLQSTIECRLDKLQCCTGKHSTNSEENISSESSKSNTNQSTSSSCQSKSEESSQSEVKSDKSTDTSNMNKIGQLRAINVKYSVQRKSGISGIKLDVIPKSRRRLDETDTPLSQQQMHVAYSTVASGSRICNPNVYEIIKQVSSGCKNLPAKSEAPEKNISKKIHKSDTSQDQDNVVTLFQKHTLSGSIFSTVQNEIPLKKSLSRSVSIKTPFSTLHESASSLISEYYARQTQADRKDSNDPKYTISSLIGESSKPERETQSQTFRMDTKKNRDMIEKHSSVIKTQSETSKLGTEQKSDVNKIHPLKEERSKRIRKTDTITHDITAFRADEQVIDRVLERTRSKHLHKHERKREERAIMMRNNDVNVETKESKREWSNALRESRRELRENKDIHDTNSNRLNGSQNTEKVIEETKKNIAIVKEDFSVLKGDLVVEKQQEIHKESKDITKELTDIKIMSTVTSQRESKRSTRDSYLEIKIDRPNAEISVGVTGSMVGRIEKPRILTQSKRVIPCTEKTEEQIICVAKESKIPKRSTPETHTSHTRSPEPENRISKSPAAKIRSKIPQLKKRAADDITIQTEKPPSKLNVTL